LLKSAELADFANSVGVMILPELDGPAHIAMGYQWGRDAGLGDLAICTDPEGVLQSGWTLSGLGPPTGQLNLGNKNVYPVLADVHKEVIGSIFKGSTRFHVGGDEIMVGSDEAWASCYNSTDKAKDIVALLEQRGLDRNDPQSFYQLWKEYNYEIAKIVEDAYSSKSVESSNQAAALQKMHIWGGNGLDATGVTYNMMLQNDVTTTLPPSKYTIQVWDTSTDSIIPSLVSSGYDVVLSHTDYVYLDCGNAGWAHAGGYWCQPYHEWQHMYEYITDLEKVWGDRVSSDAWNKQILGSETLAWSEMISDINVDQKVWPRTAALAEALWGRSPTKGASWFAADPRLQQWTVTLQERGVMAEPLQTRWCEQRGNYACTINSGTPQ
jgi:N-acetyl-beta-hexosaminidase